MNIAIVGSRGFTDRVIIERSIRRWMQLDQTPDAPITIVSGGARGADSIGEAVAKSFNLPTIIHLPQWEVYGKSAGYKRNALIVRDADVVLAFFAPGPRSKGTANTVASAKLAGKTVHEYHAGTWYSHNTIVIPDHDDDSRFESR